MSPQAAFLAKIAACGLNPHGIAVRYDAELQSEIISLAPTSGIGEQHFECLWSVAKGSFVEIAENNLASKYNAFAEAKAHTWMLGKATDWLKAHGKFDGAPTYRSGSDLRGWAERVEVFCGLDRGAALQVLSPTQLTMKPFAMEAAADPRDECLFYVLTLSDLERAGIEFGFIGNEYVPGEKQ